MKEKYLRATLKTIEVEGKYLYETKAIIDGANKLITIDIHHKNTINNIDEWKTLTIGYEELRQLNNIINKEM
jgi:hypothetical protein